MRAISLVALVMGLFVLTSGPIAGQGKDKDKDPKKDPTGNYPTEIGGKDLAQWVQELQDTDSSNRQAAVRAIVQFGPGAKKAVAKVASRLYPANESDALVRADAAAAISMIGVDKEDKKIYDYTLAALAEALADGQRSVRVQAASTLGRFGTDARGAIPKLAGTLQDESSWELRLASARALGAIGRGEKGADGTAMKALVARLIDPCASVRMEVITSLSVLGPAADEKLAATERKFLEDRLVKERDQRVRLWVRVLLMFLDEKNYMTAANFNALAKSLGDEDARVRAQAAQALGTLGPKAKDQVPVLLKAAEDKEPEVQIAAIGALARIGDPACLKLFTKILKDDKEQLTVRATVARAAGAMGKAGQPLLGELSGLLTNKDPDVVLAAIGGLAGFGELGKSALPDLKKLTDATPSFEAHFKEAATKAAAEETTRTKDTVKAAAEEAIKHISASTSTKK